MSQVTIKSKGTFSTSEVAIDGKQIDPTNLMTLRLFYEPNVEQTGCEIVFVNDEGKVERWSGVNVDDEFEYLLDAVQDDVRYRVVSDGKAIEIKVSLPDAPDAPGLPLFQGAAMVVEVVADGWGLQLNKYHQVQVNPFLRSV